MVKKITALVFITIANLILLAHAVVPHHHHDSVMCMCYSLLHNHESGDEHDNSGHSKFPAEHPENDNCLLNEAVIIPSAQHKIIKSEESFTVNPLPDLFLMIAIGHDVILPVTGYELKYPPDIVLPFTHLSYSHGLRAPPVL